MHQPYSVLAERLRALPPPPADRGKLVLVVARPEVDGRLLPERARLTPEGGVEGDRWALRPNPNPEAQITMMRADVARLMGGDRPLSVPGDNLVVELDLSTRNLPAGTRLRIGTALCEVTPYPHTGCRKFAARYGDDAREITGAPEFVAERLRGIYVRVVEAGEAGPGDDVTVLSRTR